MRQIRHLASAGRQKPLLRRSARTRRKRRGAINAHFWRIFELKSLKTVYFFQKFLKFFELKILKIFIFSKNF